MTDKGLNLTPLNGKKIKSASILLIDCQFPSKLIDEIMQSNGLVIQKFYDGLRQLFHLLYQSASLLQCHNISHPSVTPKGEGNWLG